MKNKVQKILIVAIISLTLYSCAQDRGSEITSNLVYNEFDAIEIKSSADVEITYGNVQEIFVEGFESRVKNIKNNVVNNKLVIDEESVDLYATSFNNRMKYYITIPKIVSVEIRGSSDVKINDFEQNENLKLDISGSGNVDLYQFLNTKNLFVDISGAGDIRGLSSFDNLENIDINISGSGDYSAFLIEADNVKIDISGSGDCKVSASKELIIDISGSGDIEYKGNATVVSNVSGSGDVINVN